MGLDVESMIILQRTQASPLPAESPELHVLAEYVRTGRCALFVGAGLSVGAGLPDWHSLMRRLLTHVAPWRVDPKLLEDVDRIPEAPDLVWRDPSVVAVRQALGAKRFDQLMALVKRRWPTMQEARAVAMALEIVMSDTDEHAELSRLLEKHRYQELAGYCRERMGAGAFQVALRDALTLTRGIPATHRDIVRTPYSCVVTTNFDSLLEQAYADFAQRGIPRAPTGIDLSQLGTLLLDGAFFILKAHGDWQRPETMIFTADDYRRVIHSTPAFQAVMSGILMTNTVIFVGYSLSDTNFRLLLDQQLTVFRGQVPPRYILMSGVGHAEQEILWRTARLRVLEYPDGEHHHVGRFLERLADVSTGSPALRVRRRQPDTRAVVASSDPARATLTIGVVNGALVLQLAIVARGRRRDQVWSASVSPSELHALSRALSAALHSHGFRRNTTTEILAVGTCFKRWLPPTFLARLRTLPEGTTFELVAEEGVHTLPWEWVPVGDGPLSLRYALARRPVTLPDAARGTRRLDSKRAALVIGDAGSGQPPALDTLFGAEREGDGIAALLRARLSTRRVTLLQHAAATRDRILRELRSGRYDIVHFAGHAWFTETESYFWAWDSVILGSELAPLLARNPPALLCMSTHYTSFLPVGFDADAKTDLQGSARCLSDLNDQQHLGFAEVAMRCGVASFVGSFGSPPDLDAADFMIDFFDRVARGKSVAEALLSARRRAMARKRTTGLMFTVTGYGDLRCT